MDIKKLKQLLSLLEDGPKEKAVANYGTGTLLTQPRGMFSVVGVNENPIISTHVSPMGLAGEIPAYPNFVTDPRYGVFVGYSDRYGSRPTNPCDYAPAGYSMAGTLTAQFGRVQHDTNTIEIDSVLDQTRGVGTNLQMLNSILGDSGSNGIMRPGSINEAQAINLVVTNEMVGAGVQFERDFSTLFWQGNNNNNTSGGGHKEWPGLDYQIATGQVDAETGTTIPALDSYVVDWNFTNVTSTSRDIVTDVSRMERYLFDLANKTRMAPVTWKIVMRPELWYELSDIWPCRYNTNRCSSASNNERIVFNDGSNIRMRDGMREGLYLEVNGRRYDVILDDGIYEYNNANSASVPKGSYASAINFVPVMVRGNFPVLYWEYKDFRRVSSEIAPLGAGQRAVSFWSDEGKFLWVYRDNGFCFLLQAKSEPRVILRTPHLAGKIQRILYTTEHLASPYPSSPYWRGGGVSMRTATTGQAVWQ